MAKRVTVDNISEEEKQKRLATLKANERKGVGFRPESNVSYQKLQANQMKDVPASSVSSSSRSSSSALQFFAKLYRYIVENLPAFGVRFTITSVMSAVYYAAGATLLYMSKVAQSGLLPIFGKCFPFKDGKLEHKDAVVNIFETKIDSTKKSIHLLFKKEEADTNILLDLIRNYENSNSSSKFVLYFLSIMSNLVLFNYNMVYKVLSKADVIPDALFILLSPFVFLVGISVLIIANNLYFLFLWFYEMHWFFKKNANCGKKGNSLWVDMTLWASPISYYFAFIMCIIMSILAIVVVIAMAMYPLYTVPMMAMIYTFMSVLNHRSIFVSPDANNAPETTSNDTSDDASASAHIPSRAWKVIVRCFTQFKFGYFVCICMFMLLRSEMTSVLDNFMKNVQRVDFFGTTSSASSTTNASLDLLNKQQNKMTNAASKLLGKSNNSRGATTLNTMFTSIMLMIIFVILLYNKAFALTDFAQFQSSVNPKNNKNHDLHCDAEEKEDPNTRSFLYKGYMFIRTLFDYQKQMVETRNKLVKEQEKREDKQWAKRKAENEQLLSADPKMASVVSAATSPTTGQVADKLPVNTPDVPNSFTTSTASSASTVSSELPPHQSAPSEPSALSATSGLEKSTDQQQQQQQQQQLQHPK